MLQEGFELQILACLEQNEERYVSLEPAVAEKLASVVQQQLLACILAEESSDFEIKVCIPLASKFLLSIEDAE